MPRQIFENITIRTEEDVMRIVRGKLQMVASAMMFKLADRKWSSNWGTKNDNGLRDPVDRMATEDLAKYVGDRINSYPYKFSLKKFQKKHGDNGLAYVLGYNTRNGCKVNDEFLRMIDSNRTCRTKEKRFEMYVNLPHNVDSDRRISRYVENYSVWDQMVRDNRQLREQVNELVDNYDLLQEDYEDLDQEFEDVVVENRILNRVFDSVNLDIDLEERQRGLVYN